MLAGEWDSKQGTQRPIVRANILSRSAGSSQGAAIRDSDWKKLWMKKENLHSPVIASCHVTFLSSSHLRLHIH